MNLHSSLGLSGRVLLVHTLEGGAISLLLRLAIVLNGDRLNHLHGLLIDGLSIGVVLWLLILLLLGDNNVLNLRLLLLLVGEDLTVADTIACTVEAWDLVGFVIEAV